MRNIYWDEARGFAVVAVVAIHAANAAIAFPVSSENFVVGTVLRQFVDFAVPAFLAIAGYFAGSKPIGSYWHYVWPRLLRILVPYLVWTLIYLLLLKRQDFFSLKKIVLDIALGQGIGIGYFIIVLAQMILLTPFIAHLQSARMHLGVIFLGTLAGLSLTYAIQFSGFSPKLATFPYFAIPFIVWYPFYHLGFLAARGQATVLKASHWVYCAAWLACIGLGLLEAWWLVSVGLPVFASSQLKASSILGSLLLLFWWRSRDDDPVQLEWLADLGRRSFFIYFSHLLAFGAITTALDGIPYLSERQALYILILLVSAITACSIAAKFLGLFSRQVQSLIGL